MARYIIDKCGRILGRYRRDDIPYHRKHRDRFRLAIQAPRPPISNKTNLLTVETIAFETVEFTLWEVPIYDRHGDVATHYWYLVAPDDMPERAWKSPDLLDMRHAWMEKTP